MFDPRFNFSEVLPSFSVNVCDDVDVLNTMMKMFQSYPIIGDKIPLGNISDAKPLSIVGEALTTFTSGIIGFALTELSENSTLEIPQISVVEHTSIKPKLISGEDAAMFTSLFKGNIDNSTSLSVGAQQYSVIHNGIAYTFVFMENSTTFDRPENVKLRQQILDSIRFIS